MTGLFFRVQRDGVWLNLQIEHMTPKERRESLKERDHEYLQKILDRCSEVLSNISHAIGEE